MHFLTFSYAVYVIMICTRSRRFCTDNEFHCVTAFVAFWASEG